jgi:hypothetical protein
VQLRQAILNLIMNAIEATGTVPEGPRDPLMSSRRQPPDSVVVAVRDAGVGIGPANLDRIFEPVLHDKIARNGNGTDDHKIGDRTAWRETVGNAQSGSRSHFSVLGPGRWRLLKCRNPTVGSGKA